MADADEQGKFNFETVVDFVDEDHRRAESGHYRPHKGFGECCPTCQAPTVDYRHTLSKGLANTLIRLYRFKGSRARVRDLHLGYGAASNFQKLRYWNLVEYASKEDKRLGFWSLTDIGEKFVRATIRLRKFAWTYRAQPVEYEGEEVLITDLVPDFNWRIDYAQEAREHETATT